MEEENFAVVEKKPRILIFDLETADFNADVGFMIAFGYMWLGDKKAKCLRIDDYARHKRNPTDDKSIVYSARRILCEADMLVSWYGRNRCFDEPFTRTRLAIHGFDPIPKNIPHWDGQREARQYFKFKRNTLDNVGRAFHIDIKTHFSGPIWMRAIGGHRPSISRIVDHCEKDVKQLHDVYLKMRAHVPHPNLALISERTGLTCPTCCSERLKSWGYRYTTVGRYRRWRCLDCKTFSQGRFHVGPKVELR